MAKSMNRCLSVCLCLVGLFAAETSWSRQHFGIEMPIGSSEKVKQELLRMLRSESPSARCGGVIGVGKFGPEAKDAVPGLVAALSDPEPFIRWQAVRTFDRVGPGAVPALV